MSRKVFDILLAGLVLALSGQTIAAQEAATVTVGAWNVEWLGTPEMRDSTARTINELEAVAAVVADLLDIEVLVLVEINTESPQWATLKALLEQRGYGFVQGAPKRQNIVVAFDLDEVEAVNLSDPEPDVPTAFERADPAGGSCRTSRAKRPVFATLRSGDFDFTVVGVHFKSGRRPSNCQDDGFTSWVRGRQSAAILDAIALRQAEGTIDDDVIVVGDFNGGFDDGSTSILRAGGFRILTEPANRSSSSGSLSYRKGPWESVLDHIAIRPVTDREWIARTTTYFPDVLQFTETELARYLAAYSDHAVVLAEFRRTLSDDD